MLAVDTAPCPLAVVEATYLKSFFFWWDWGLNSRQALYHLGHISRSYCSGYFGDGVSKTVFLDWPPTVILPISAFQVVRITGEPLAWLRLGNLNYSG
jgi:hypothetical protein